MPTPNSRRRARTSLKRVEAATFFIDARFLLRNTTETFWGAPLIVVDGKDNTFAFGFIRDLLRLRQALHISGGAVVLGAESSLYAPQENIRSVAALCRELGILVVEEPTLPVLMIAAAHINYFSNIVTEDRRMLQFCTERRSVYLGKDPSLLERLTPDVVWRTLGVSAEQVPTYLALTQRTKSRNAGNGADAVTALEARRLVELHGDLSGIYHQLPRTKSPTLRKKLIENQSTFEQRCRENTARVPEALPELPRSLSWNLEGIRQDSLLRQQGFHSLRRILPLSDRFVQLPEATNSKSRSSKSYRAVLNCREYNELLGRAASAKACAIDTEADGKDPCTATLFGISFALTRGEAFFVPFCAGDMGDLTPRKVQLGVKKLFMSRTTFVGHNLKYDFTLLRRNGIEPPPVCFDTFLASHDCYGDLDISNLPFLSQKLLGRKIRGYRDIVPKEKTFLELPFNEMKEHACTDADIALQLHARLEKELKERRISQQFEEQTMLLARTLLDMEKDGVPVDGKRLEKLRRRIVAAMLQAKKGVIDAIGSEVDLDSPKQISVLLKEKLGLQEVLGRRSLTESLLEQLAPQRPLLKLVVEYRRHARQARRIESIIKAIHRGRVYPSFSQTREADGRVSSTGPDLFADDGLDGLFDCIGGNAALWLKDRRRSLELAQEASSDPALKKDWESGSKLNRFMKGQTTMDGLDHDELLLRVLIGESLHRLSTRFLVDRLTINEIVRTLEVRYSRLFGYIAGAKEQALKRGYVERNGMRRYFAGFASSNLEKRARAQLLACRWLLMY